MSRTLRTSPLPSHSPNILRGATLLALFAGAGCSASFDDSVGTDPSQKAGDELDSKADRRRQDADRDGFVSVASGGRDCDDTRSAVNPRATETCATTYDDDCDGNANELNAATCVTFFSDADGDSFGDPADAACYCSATGAWDTTDSTDCDDTDGTVNPGASEVAGDGVDQDCDGIDLATSFDADGDGFDAETAGGTDCDDADASVNPSAAEVLDDGIDQDCDGVDEVSASGPAPLYGFWGLNGYTSASGFTDVQSRMGMTVFQVACSTPNWCVNTLLPMVKAAGLKVTFRMTGGPSYDTTSGSFDIAKWKAQLPGWESYAIQSYIDDGTLVGHMLLDDIKNYSSKDATADELDEMARYSKELFPGLMTYVRERATEMPVPSSGEYTYVDACVNQYQANHGEITWYASAQEDAALALNLGTINGLNIADGGDGSSGQPGWRSGYWAMSAAEITEYGNELASVPSMGMFLNWEYDGDEAWSDGTIGDEYFNEPEFEAALEELSVVVGSHAPVTLLKP